MATAKSGKVGHALVIHHNIVATVNGRTVSQLTYTATIPVWLDPPPASQGSIDPLGYLAPAEKLADQLLPGVTVATRRARYLSFLCWAIRETGGNSAEIDRWEIALSVGEYLRHGSNTAECNYLGSQLVDRADLDPGDALPANLHVQTCRQLYSGLVRSCGLCDESRRLTKLGDKIANEFGKDMPRSRPRQVFRCEAMPCLSAIRGYEKGWLREALLESNDASGRRSATFREIGPRRWHAIATEGVSSVLSGYLSQNHAKQGTAARCLHEAAKLELQSMPLTRLFLYLYQRKGAMPRAMRRHSRFHAYSIPDGPERLLPAVAAHLRKASSLGASVPPLQTGALADWLCVQHRKTKPDAPWVNERWKALRLGLQPQRHPGVHEYRLTAFASLLRDLEVV